MLKAFFVAFLGFVYTCFSVVYMLDGKSIDSKGKTAQVEPLKQYTQVTKKRGGRIVDQSYEANISFATEEGRTVTVKKSGLSASLINKINMGKEPVLIRYLPDKPTTTRIEGKKGFDGSSVTFGVIIFLIGCLWFRNKFREQPTFRD